MTDDIVTRLRGADAGFRIVVGTNEAFAFPTLHTEAADEIERLRKLTSEPADQLFDYSMSVAALRSQIFDLLNDKYASDFERLQKPNDRERSAIDGWLDIMEERNER